MKPLLFFFFLFSFGSCKAQNNPALQPELFHALPTAIDGCVAAYVYDTTSLKKEEYIFVDNMQELAFLRIMGKEIQLKKVSDSQPQKDTHKQIYKGSGYTVILLVKDVRESGEEAEYEEGTLEIIFDHNNRIFKIHGEAGC